jgi:2-alkyl-3-oxoalkanoate reductase
MGAQTVVLDGLDARTVNQTVTSASPDAVVHQMTALAGTPDPKHFDRRFDDEPTSNRGHRQNLLAAATAAGAAHFVAQSYSGWHNERRGAWVKSEEDALGDPPPAAQQRSLAAIKHLELEVAPYG